MELNEYQRLHRIVETYERTLVESTLHLSSVCGNFAGELLWHNIHKGKIDTVRMMLNLGDVLFALTEIANKLNVDLNDIAVSNLHKNNLKKVLIK